MVYAVASRVARGGGGLQVVEGWVGIVKRAWWYRIRRAMSNRNEEHDLEESCLSSCDCSDFTNLAEKYEEIVVKLSPCCEHGTFTSQCIQFLGVVSS